MSPCYFVNKVIRMFVKTIFKLIIFYVQVMDAGQIVECGHPHELLQKENGHFTKMVNQLGPASEQSLRELAKEAHAQHIRYADADEHAHG